MAELHSGQDLLNYKKSMGSIIGEAALPQEQEENARFSINKEDEQLEASKSLINKVRLSNIKGEE